MKNIFNIDWRFTIASSIICIMLFSSCTKDFKKINADKNALAVIGPAELPFLFSKAQSAASYTDEGYQTAQNLFADQYAQYFACNATYFSSDRLVIVQSWVKDAFNPIYGQVVPQLAAIIENSDPSSAENAMANVWWVWSFHRITDYWGPLPYFSAGITGESVPYDAQDKIYDDFFKRLTAAVTVLKTKAGENHFGSFDLVYGGSVNKWIKFANSLRLRLAVRISKVDPARAKTEAEAAFTSGVFTSSPDDDAFITKSLKGYDKNGLSVMHDWEEFRMSSSMKSVLTGYNDPRISHYFIPSVNSGTYEGLRNGLSVVQLGDPKNQPEALSHVGPKWASPSEGGLGTYLTTPQIVMVTGEVYFLRAEGAMLGWNMGGTAKDLYETGIANSMKQWGINDATVVNNYVNSTNTPIPPMDFLNSPAMTNIPVKFSDVSAIQLEQIATQKWLSLFPDGMEAWADFRRSHVLKLYPVVNSENPDIPDPTTQWLRRMPFIDKEKQTNGSEVTKAVQLLGGADNTITPLWWDKN